MVRFASAFFRLIVVLAMFGLAAAATITALAPSVVDIATAAEFEGVDVSTRSLATRSLVFDVNGELIQTLQGEENRELAELDDMSDQVIQAVLAIEDASFYEHPGVNVQATIRAAVENVGAGGISQGGSTITQQVIKNLVLTSEQTLARKIEEASLAIQLEQQSSKDEILNLYLNTVYFGNGAYGVQAAAETYWGLDADQLDWEHAALLAGMIANPSEYDPINRPASAGRQRSVVLNRLATLGHITEDEARFLRRTALPSERRNLDLVEENYYINQVLQLLLGEAEMASYDKFALGDSAQDRIEAVYRGGLRVFTTYDQTAQAKALQAQRDTLPDDDRGFTMAIASIEPATGAVKAIVGGPGFEEGSEYNIAVRLPGRQPGSSFKPFVLVAALEAGYSPADSVSGVGPCNFPDPFAEGGVYTVNNFAGSPGAVQSLLAQTLSSSNCGYVRLGRIVGIDKVVEVANALGVSRKLDAVTSLPLGVEEVPPLEMAQAYATIANGGIRNDPYFIERIEDAEGNIIYEHQQRGRRVIDANVACWATEVLEANVERGTGRAAQVPGQPAGGKTGTTEDFGDAWFVGFTPHLATAIWMGHPDTNQIKMRNVGEFTSVTGGSYPARAWGAFNIAYHEDRTPISFDECAPYGGGQFIRDDGSLGSNHPCIDTTQFPVDLTNNGQADACYPDPSQFGYQVCGNTQAIDDFGQPVPIFCVDPLNFSNTGGGVVDGQVQTPGLPVSPVQAQEVVITPGCNAQYPYGRDENGDGVIDRCYQFP